MGVNHETLVSGFVGIPMATTTPGARYLLVFWYTLIRWTKSITTGQGLADI